MRTQFFKTKNGDNHRIDSTGNHFINEVCVNPIYRAVDPVTGERSKIGDTHPPMSERIYYGDKK